MEHVHERLFVRHIMSEGRRWEIQVNSGEDRIHKTQSLHTHVHPCESHSRKSSHEVLYFSKILLKNVLFYDSCAMVLLLSLSRSRFPDDVRSFSVSQVREVFSGKFWTFTTMSRPISTVPHQAHYIQRRQCTTDCMPRSYE